MKVYLVSVFRIVNEQGEKINQAELLRWLGELVWMPTNLIPDERIFWKAIDENRAKLCMDYRRMHVEYDVHFAEDGQILSLKTKRYKGDELQDWIE